MPRRPRTTPRKHAQQARSRATVAALIEATAQVLAREGYGRASTNRIAAVAGVNIATLYQYFPCKEALVAALIDQHLGEVVNAVGNHLVSLTDAPWRDAIATIVRAHLRTHAARPGLHRTLLEQVPRVERLNPVVDARRRVIAQLGAYLATRPEILRVRDPDRAAFIVVHVVDALTQAAILEHPKALASDWLVEEITDVVARYLLREDGIPPGAA
jgi:AcrR family transcriptional regulator